MITREQLMEQALSYVNYFIGDGEITPVAIMANQQDQVMIAPLGEFFSHGDEGKDALAAVAPKLAKDLDLRMVALVTEAWTVDIERADEELKQKLISGEIRPSQLDDLRIEVCSIMIQEKGGGLSGATFKIVNDETLGRHLGENLMKVDGDEDPNKVRLESRWNFFPEEEAREETPGSGMSLDLDDLFS